MTHIANARELDVTGHRKSQAKTRRSGRRVGVAGWEFVHVCIDDATRLAYVEALADEKAMTAAGVARSGITAGTQRVSQPRG